MEGIKSFFIEVQCMQAYQRVLDDEENGVDSSEYDLLLASIYQESMNSGELISDDSQKMTDIFDLNQNGYIDNKDYDEILANGPMDIDNNGEISEEEVNVFGKVLETLYSFLPKFFGGRTINENDNENDYADNDDYADNCENNNYSSGNEDNGYENADVGFYGYQDAITESDNLSQSDDSVSENLIQKPADTESSKSVAGDTNSVDTEKSNYVDNALMNIPDKNTSASIGSVEVFDKKYVDENDMQIEKKTFKDEDFTINEKIGKILDEINFNEKIEKIDNWREIDDNADKLQETMDKHLSEYTDKKDKFYNTYDDEFYETNECEIDEDLDTTYIEKDIYSPKSQVEESLKALKANLISLAIESDDAEELEELKENLSAVESTLEEIKANNNNSNEIDENDEIIDETIDDNVKENIDGTASVAKEEKVSKLSETSPENEDENTLEDKETKEFMNHISRLLNLSENEKIENIKIKPDGAKEIFIDNGRILYSVIYTKFEGGEKLFINLGRKFQKELIFYNNGNSSKLTKRVLRDGKTKINLIRKYKNGTIIKTETIKEPEHQFYMMDKDVLYKENGDGKFLTTGSLVDENGEKSGTFSHEVIRPKK